MSVLVFALCVHAVYAAEPVWQANSVDGQLYIVQEHDWLTTIALTFYSDMMAYPNIVEATNGKAKTDARFLAISNPDMITVGQTLWIPRIEEQVADVPEAAISFVVIGDMPYSKEEDEQLTAPHGEFVKALQAINPPVLVHYGDFKASGEDCTDRILETRQAQIAALNPYHVVYAPGDNDWTDCDRTNMTIRFDELERLAFLRALFFTGTGLEMTRGIPGLIRQDGLPENAMWSIDKLLMGTLHIVGTNNGRKEILQSDVNLALDAVDERDALNQLWLRQLFESAKQAEGLVVVFQADIYHSEDEKPACSPENRTDCDGFKPVREMIETLALSYKKPVLVVHGDTNAYCFNQPSEDVTNLWHLNGPGDYKVIDAAHIIFTPHAVKPFTVSGILDPKEPPIVCDYSR
ncbi:MAG: hypothetical protein GY784_05130 [Gammaproteobacteria bacterium]|nr:hypothetical protein [Gammaproteobacteria bacterium]